jgi:hypothetical protein
MHHRLTAPHRLVDRGRVGDIPHHRVQVASLQAQRRHRGSDPSAVADQQAHLVASLDQGRHGMGADKAGPTGDQNAHPAPFGESEHAPVPHSMQAPADPAPSPFHRVGLLAEVVPGQAGRGRWPLPVRRTRWPGSAVKRPQSRTPPRSARGQGGGQHEVLSSAQGQERLGPVPGS